MAVRLSRDKGAPLVRITIAEQMDYRAWHLAWNAVPVSGKNVGADRRAGMVKQDQYATSTTVGQSCA